MVTPDLSQSTNGSLRIDHALLGTTGRIAAFLS
jgi:hypothetical protein